MARLAVSALALACLGGAAQAQAMASTYTRHAYDTCAKAKPDEDGVSVRHCAGQGGVAVVWTAGDDSSAVGFGAKPADETVIDASFFEAGTAIEWRGPKGGKAQAAILRYKTGQRIGKLDGSRLVVYRLGADSASCIIGSIDGRKPDANAQARKLADETAAGFRCGQDQP